MQNCVRKILSKMKKIFFAILLSRGLISCSTISELSSKNTSKSVSLVDSQWVLDYETISSTTPITLNIENNRVFGNASCNNYFGELTLGENGNFSVKNIGATRKLCDKMVAESFFLKVLEKANRYTATDSELKLYEGQILLLKFNKK